MDNMQMNNLIATQNNNEAILGKFVYYSLSNVLIDRDKFCDIGRQFGLNKIKPYRESATDAFRNATGDINKRIVTKSQNGNTKIYRIYFRDNHRVTGDRVSRELVQETVNRETNEYTKLANVYFDKTTETVGYEHVSFSDAVNPYDYINRAEELFELYKRCYGRRHVDTVVEAMLDEMEAVKISVHGKLYFVPKQHNQLVNLLEDYIAEVNRYNHNDGEIIINSMFVVDDEKQREKMSQEFYINYRKDIETYQERIQHFLDNGCTSSTIIDRWLLKIEALEQKKQTYEDILKKELHELDDDFAVLKAQTQDLRLNQLKGQTKLAA